MSSWAQQRRFVYGSVVFIILALVIVIPAWKFLYKAPSCSDGVQNGNEQGIDCGGSCERLCSSAFLPASSYWTKFEEMSPGLYHVASYIVNPNPEGEAKSAPYHVRIYDNKGVIITEYDDTVDLPPNRNTLAFRSFVNTGKRIPARAIFEFTDIPDWREKKDTLRTLQIIDKNYVEDGNNSTLTVSMKNSGVEALGRMSVFVVLYDQNKNAIGFAKTIVDEISAGGMVIAPFTWPKNRNGSVISIEVLPVAE